MKKNILLVHSFLVLPLLTSSFVLGSEKPTYAATVKGTQLPPKKQTPLNGSGSQRRNRKEKREQQAAPQVIAEKAIETASPASLKQVEAVTPVTLVAQEVTPQETVVAKAPSKYLVAELSAEEQTQAKHDLEKAKSNAKNLVDIFSVIKTISDEKSAQENGLRHVQAVATTQETSAPAKVIQITLSEDLEKSVMSPSESKGFGFADTLLNAIRSYRTTIIKLLANETFEPTNATHKEYFNLALEECATQKDMQSLTEILNLCKKEKYNNLQSSLNHVAPAFNFVANDFAAAITASNRALITSNQECAAQINRASAEFQEKLTALLNGHREAVTAIAKRYNEAVDGEQKNYADKKAIVASISALNAKAESYKNDLLFEYTLHVPTNAVAAIENDTHTKVRHMLTHKNMPQAKTLQLTDK